MKKRKCTNSKNLIAKYINNSKYIFLKKSI